MRYILFLLILLMPLPAMAVDAPAGQTRLTARDVLRGSFTEERQMKGIDTPMQMSGHFVIAPSRGLLWMMAKPLQTTTVITPDGLTQMIGGMAMKLPAKNLRHVYDMVGGALMGDWSELENDFAITRSGDGQHWQMLLTPRPDGHAKLPYTAITVSGGRFVEHIVMSQADGSFDAMNFTDAVLSPAPPSDSETALFGKALP